jgi:hypothetical protein
MIQQYDQFSKSIFDLFRNLGAVSLSSSQELITWQINSAEVLFSVGSKQLRTVLSDIGAAKEPDQWPEAVQAGLRNAIEMTRDSVVAVADCQLEGMRLLPKQVDETRRFFAESFSALAPKIDLVRSGDKKSNKTTTLYSQQKAA